MIEKCFKCDGEGILLVMDYRGVGSLQPGSYAVERSLPCPKCLGSGALDYRVVETQAVVGQPIRGGELPPRSSK